jgi:hypothetical protein
VDLHYLISFYGDETQLEPHRLLGSAVRTLHAKPVLTRTMIESTKAAVPLLATTDLADDVELVKLTPLALSLEELSKLWSVFFQTPYALSVAYQGTVVLIESKESPETALPVRERNLYVLPFRQPVIEEVGAKDGVNRSIVGGDVLLIKGRQLRGDDTTIRIAGREVIPALQDVSETQIRVQLSSPPLPAGALRAGVQGVQVVHHLLMGTPLVPHRGVESNVAAFVLHPTIAPGPVTSSLVTLTVDPPVVQGQRLVLLLNERVTMAPAAYTFTDKQPATGSTVQITIGGVKPAEYFLRLQVDGAESPVDLDPGSPTFGPKVTIP